MGLYFSYSFSLESFEALTIFLIFGILFEDLLKREGERRNGWKRWGGKMVKPYILHPSTATRAQRATRAIFNLAVCLTFNFIKCISDFLFLFRNPSVSRSWRGWRGLAVGKGRRSGCSKILSLVLQPQRKRGRVYSITPWGRKGLLGITLIAFS